MTSDVREQTRLLAGQTRDQLVEQATHQKEQAARSLRSVGDELRGMAEHGQSGWGAQLAQHGAEYTDQAADFLQKHEPGDLLEEVRGLARRRPGMFLLVAATAGVVAGRLTRALAAGTPSGSSGGSGNGISRTPGGVAGGRRTGMAPDDDYLVPPPAGAPSAPPVPHTTPPPAAPMEPPPGSTMRPPEGTQFPTPTVPDLDPGAPVEPRFGPGSGQ
ncbi:hypothetical protein F1D05_06775 [Kribbella qitaiheensis]|uniref:Uncharacterized protein n=1 Tax=Kribbella qitaiheensis TaxID=1544730 RepID=A0A7G6WUJ5_9ACTN|nr:hypothetical protein [Kribbella qitaiheensis]QNE17660.1 hypothetical protein F1D05_06775 [Kribbella qitaiheensis]